MTLDLTESLKCNLTNPWKQRPLPLLSMPKILIAPTEIWKTRFSAQDL